jgi:NTP pyrophosphatase (non-canonical NTP hydrolase)
VIDLNTIQVESLYHARRRFLAKNTKNTLKHLFSELKEAKKEIKDKNYLTSGYELADIILVTCTLAEQLGINIEDFIKDKHEFNKVRR